MGQKIHPVGLRVGVIRDWEGRWFAEKDYATLLHEDLKIRRFIKSRLYNAGIARVEIERAANRVKVTIHTARPGMVIGRGGTEVENLRKSLEKLTDKQVSLNIAEVKVPDLNAQLVAENICFQLERRSSYRRAMKQAISRVMKLGALGVKIKCSGRLMGAEIARSEGYSEGKVPLHTLRADIDYGFAEANTTYGKIGVKVWINKGEVLPEKKVAEGEEGK
ncbi:MAG TPA: 30S ribosomal protein S3 [Hydrogenispora sp.]|jgi:small subunit ribosomal protein S3|nr:30S ribosomal protein S3 [Hydrogenispora sp.]